MSTDLLAPYDAVVLLSFGGPEGPDEVVPFLRRVTAGRGIPDERLAAVGEHYFARGGVSPINAANRRLRADLEAALRARGSHLPVVWANRHTEPHIIDVLTEGEEQGWRRIVVVVTSAHPSYSSCRQYRENLADGLPEGSALIVDKLRPYAADAAFVDPNRDLVLDAVRPLLEADQAVRLLFVTHSIPTAMNDSSGAPGEGQAYARSHADLAQHLADAVREQTGVDVPHEVVYCSRSGPPTQPWLEPDINDAIDALAGTDVTVVAVPIGFVSDHMEVVHDLDTEAAASADAAGVGFVRVDTVGTHPSFVTGLVDLLVERAAEAEGGQDPRPDRRPSICAAGCCPNPREQRPALCGRD